MAQKKTENNAGNTEKTERKAAEKIRIKAVLRGSYGAFNPGDTAEVAKTLAEAFLTGGFADKLK